jgi:uncharacterized membrane protein
MTPTISEVVLIVIGVIAMLGAVFNWWIITRSRRLFNLLLGHRAARVIYFIVGVFLFIRGVGFLIGKNWL